MKRLARTWGLCWLACWLLACGANTPVSTPAPASAAPLSRPTLLVSAPADGAQFTAGATVQVQSTSHDARGVLRVELWVDGVLYRADVAKETDAPRDATIAQTWLAKDAGAHVLVVKAINLDGNASGPETVHVDVIAPVTATPKGTPTSAPVTFATGTVPASCQLNAAYVSDVTVPDGTAFKPSEQINKVWRLRNTGNCAWGAGYQLSFIEGAQLGDVAVVNVPTTAPGATADVNVPLVAPRNPGTYMGRWRMRAPNATLFGQPLTVVIKVVQ
jgi:hypothetical protein